MRHIPSSILCGGFLLLGICLGAVAAAETTDSLNQAVQLKVECSRPIGVIRPLHGGNCGPIQYGELVDLSAQFRELAMPLIRLHDCHWPNPDVVDIHTIFVDFKADPERAESYDFRRTDDYIQATINAGSRIVYRLGESIEHTKRKYFVHPPADCDKWAAVCVGIIRHYNEGWAGGFRHNIQYWEIWNEPENRPAMWTGNDEEYFRLYETAAKAIKARFPNLKVGGPSLGYTGKIEGGAFKPGEFMERFLTRCRERALPLDFFSWHLYTKDPSECVVRARGIRETLDRHGFKQAELHFNEWNYLPNNDWAPIGLKGQGAPRERFFDEIAGARGAAFAACALIFLQDSPVDVANYYRSDTDGFGMFTANGTPRKSFHAFKAFRQLLATPERLTTSGSQAGRLAICAGANRERAEVGVLISNYSSASDKIDLAVSDLPWSGPSACEMFVVDAARDLAKTKEFRIETNAFRFTEELKAPSVCLIKIRSATAPK
ncbi:MAG: hypothetical protein NTX50_18240 [Candidatus Sumerlaeota bacterium]|nr:hypothetical protein [Candidatus Sumerlaeota bacterium]